MKSEGREQGHRLLPAVFCNQMQSLLPLVQKIVLFRPHLRAKPALEDRTSHPKSLIRNAHPRL